MATLSGHGQFTPRRGEKSRTGAHAIGRAELAAQAIALRRDGLTNSEIAARLSVDGSSRLNENKVQELIASHLRALVKPAADELRAEELDRLDRIFNRSVRIFSGDTNRDRVAAGNLAVKVMERRAALLGLDAPKAIDLKDDRQHVPSASAVEEVLARLIEESRKDEAG